MADNKITEYRVKRKAALKERSELISTPVEPTVATGFFCKIYKCARRVANNTGYCVDHVSPLRTGLAPYTAGSAPVVTKKYTPPKS